MLNEAVHGFLLQNRTDSEMVIVNDYTKHKIIFDHTRVKVYNTVHRFLSVGEKKQFAAEHSLGDIIVPLDDDDIMLPGYLDVCENILENNAWAYPLRTLIYNRRLGAVQLSTNLGLNSFIFRREVVEMCSYPKTNFNINRGLFEQAKIYFKGDMPKLSIDDLKYISMWDEDQVASYHVRVVGQGSKVDSERYKAIDGHVSLLGEPVGEVKLTPGFSRDYENLKMNWSLLVKDIDIYNPSGTVSSKPISKQALVAKTGWQSAKKAWEDAEGFIGSVASRGFVATVADMAGLSGVMGNRVDEKTLELRRKSCFGDDLSPACEMLLTALSGNKYCGACGCGERKLSKLNEESPGAYTKLHYPKLMCPLKREGFSSHLSDSV
jgi:hypothetical protein